MYLIISHLLGRKARGCSWNFAIEVGGSIVFRVLKKKFNEKSRKYARERLQAV